MGQGSSTPAVTKSRGPIQVAGPVIVEGRRIIRKEITEEKACYQADQVVVQIIDGSLIRE